MIPALDSGRAVLFSLKGKPMANKKTYYVTYTFGASIPVEATSEEEAEAMVEEMDTDELLARARDGFEIQGVKEE